MKPRLCRSGSLLRPQPPGTGPECMSTGRCEAWRRAFRAGGQLEEGGQFGSRTQVYTESGKNIKNVSPNGKSQIKCIPNLSSFY